MILSNFSNSEHCQNSWNIFYFALIVVHLELNVMYQEVVISEITTNYINEGSVIGNVDPFGLETVLVYMSDETTIKNSKLTVPTKEFI